MQSTTPHDDLLGLGDAVVADGFGPHETAVDELVARARRAGIRPVLADVLADRSTPTAPRQRALGKLLAALVAVGERPQPCVAATAA